MTPLEYAKTMAAYNQWMNQRLYQACAELSDEQLKRNNLKARLLMQVHDELLLEVPHGEVDQVAKMIKHEMETAVSLDVPLVADVGVGDNWMDAKP